MPGTQIASQGNFDFGAPAASGEVLRFRTKKSRGGKLILVFENPSGGANDLTVSVQVAPSIAIVANGVESPDTFVATDAALNLAAVTDLVVAKNTTREVTILIRPGIDTFMRVLASGATRGIMQIRGDDILEPNWTDQFAVPPTPIG